VTSRRSRILRVLLVCILIWPLVAWLGARLLITEAPLDNADAIVVLGGAANYRERAREAARLLLDGHSQRILITNDNTRGPWSEAEQRNLYFNERALQVIKDAGVPAEKVELLMQPVTSTYEEAELIKNYVADRGLRSVLIVTSAYHSRRALWTFSHVFRGTGVQVGLIRVDPGDQSPRPATWWFTKRGWKFVPTEYVKMLYYVVKYR